MGEAVTVGIALQRLNHAALSGVRNIFEPMAEGGNTVIGRSEELVRMPQCEAMFVEQVEAVVGPIVPKMAPDHQQALSFLLEDEVIVPNLFQQAARCHVRLP